MQRVATEEAGAKLLLQQQQQQQQQWQPAKGERANYNNKDYNSNLLVSQSCRPACLAGCHCREAMRQKVWRECAKSGEREGERSRAMPCRVVPCRRWHWQQQQQQQLQQHGPSFALSLSTVRCSSSKEEDEYTCIKTVRKKKFISTCVSYCMSVYVHVYTYKSVRSCVCVHIPALSTFLWPF